MRESLHLLSSRLVENIADRLSRVKAFYSQTKIRVPSVLLISPYTSVLCHPMVSLTWCILFFSGVAWARLGKAVISTFVCVSHTVLNVNHPTQLTFDVRGILIMATGTYYIDRNVWCLGHNGPVEEPLVPEFVERGNVVLG